MLEFLMEVVVEFLFEFLLSLIAEVVTEIATHLFGANLRNRAVPTKLKQLSPWYLLPAFTCFGAALGIASVWLFPNHFIATPHLRLANLALTPIFVGISSALLSTLSTGGQSPSEVLRHAAQAFLFALALTGTRFFLAN
jgi:hypothetical protein